MDRAALTFVALVAVALNLGGLRDRLLGRPVAHQITSVAILPLENLSGDPEQEYFADGMTEALISNLGRISSLRVISRTSAMHYKGTKKQLPEIASELSVDAVVEGSVLRSEDRVRITTQLIQANPEQHLWSQSYERDLRDVLNLQGEVARAIAQQVDAKLERKRKSERGRGTATEANVSGDSFLLDQGHILDEQSEHPLAFPLGSLRVVPERGKVFDERKHAFLIDPLARRLIDFFLFAKGTGSSSSPECAGPSAVPMPSSHSDAATSPVAGSSSGRPAAGSVTPHL